MYALSPLIINSGVDGYRYGGIIRSLDDELGDGVLLVRLSPAGSWQRLHPDLTPAIFILLSKPSNSQVLTGGQLSYPSMYCRLSDDNCQEHRCLLKIDTYNKYTC